MITTVKFLQGKLLQYDAACFDARRRKHAEVHSSQVLESLGQITHVFSDKTGTLTCNQMVYKRCAVADKVYGDELGGTKSVAGQEVSVSRTAHVDFAAGRTEFLCAAEKA